MVFSKSHPCHFADTLIRHNVVRDKIINRKEMNRSGKIILAILLGFGIARSVSASTMGDRENLTDVSGSQLILSQRASTGNSQFADSFKNIIGLTGLAIGTGAIGYHLARTYQPTGAALSQASKANRHNDLLGRVRPKLRRELLRLVHNQATAKRLLSGTQTSHPGRNPNWLAEKVIYDLKRGR